MKGDNATHPMTVDLVGTMHVALVRVKKLQKWNIYLNVLSFKKGCLGIFFYYINIIRQFSFLPISLIKTDFGKNKKLCANRIV
ncbi:hypothetical protein DSC47_11120 [Elizabethkingia miricola]|nr:hypothetical protein BAY07_19695 [Elizabethkingia bruuniana]OPC62488.1 hypothetical protein BAY13_06615 [Elizabethkingia bruuniana]RBI91824.1 hypothetical protein DSC47_11120 [Elizabethkingia miricola]